MKLPSWLIASMLTSCTLVTSAGAALWVTGPERTARNFGRLFALHQFEEASLLLATQAQMHDIESEVESLFQQQETPPQFNLRVARRSISDTMCGKLQFVISVEIHEHGHVQLHFQVCNGMVRFVKEEYRTPDGRVVFVDARECAEPGINAPAFGRSPPTGALVSTRSLGGDLGRSQTGGG